MKVVVVGCGAVGSFYGAQLVRAGHEVYFLLRSDYAVVRAEGVHIRSPAGDFHVRPRCANRPEAVGPADLVLIALKTTANHQFPVLLPPLVGAHTVLLTLQNGLGNDEELARLFPPAQVLGGHCFVCLNRVAPGQIVHLDHGQIVIGEFEGSSRPRTHALAEAFRAARVACEVTENLRQAHWEKLLWNIPFNGVGVAGLAGYEALLSPEAPIVAPPPGAACLTTDVLLNDPRWAGLLRELMLEVIATARTLGLQIPVERADRMFALTRTMGAYKASTLWDFERGLPLELESMFLRPRREAQRRGVPTPRLDALCRALHVLDAHRQRARHP